MESILLKQFILFMSILTDIKLAHLTLSFTVLFLTQCTPLCIILEITPGI